jgi:hypothetical protein
MQPQDAMCYGDITHIAGSHAIISALNKSTQSNIHSYSLNTTGFKFTDSCKNVPMPHLMMAIP